MNNITNERTGTDEEEIRNVSPARLSLPIIAEETPRSHDELVSVQHAKVFLKSLETAADCRFEASSRLKHRGMTSFFVTTALSLGLIFIPIDAGS